MSLTALAAAGLGQALVTRVGPRIPMATGVGFFAVGLALLTQISSGGEYLSDLLPGLLVTGIGLGLGFVAMSIGALEGIEERDAGLASGLINTTQQVGGALGVAVLSTLAITRSNDLLATGTDAPAALTEGFQIALLAGAAFAAAGALAVLGLVRRPRRVPEPAVIAEPASAET